MASWAYRCHSSVEGEADWYVSLLDAQRLGPEVRIVRVKVGRDWKCAVLDRSQPFIIDDQLLRSVIASNANDCPECADMIRAAAPAEQSTAESSESQASSENGEHRERPPRVNAAAISLQGQEFMVVFAPIQLVASPGEADMAIDDLRPYFGGVPVVLLGQQDDGSPSYYGDRQLVELLAGIPPGEMPWKEYPLG